MRWPSSSFLTLFLPYKTELCLLIFSVCVRWKYSAGRMKNNSSSSSSAFLFLARCRLRSFIAELKYKTHKHWKNVKGHKHACSHFKKCIKAEDMDLPKSGVLTGSQDGGGSSTPTITGGSGSYKDSSTNRSNNDKQMSCYMSTRIKMLMSDDFKAACKFCYVVCCQIRILHFAS